MEREVLPVPANRSATILDDSYTLSGADGSQKEMHNLTPLQKAVKAKVGAGPWCDLPDEVLAAHPWTSMKAVGVRGITEQGDVAHHLMEAAKHSLQRARLRVTNSRLLGMNPGVLEALQPSSDMSEQNQALSSKLLEYFENTIPDLRKKDLHEILKWGRWRTFYRPGTVLVRQGEEAHYVGLVLQGRLALYTEDEITRSKSLVTYVDRYDLVGSEDFSSKFRTARRTIQMPRHVRTFTDTDGPPTTLITGETEGQVVTDTPQCLGNRADGSQPGPPDAIEHMTDSSSGYMTDCVMYRYLKVCTRREEDNGDVRTTAEIEKGALKNGSKVAPWSTFNAQEEVLRQKASRDPNYMRGAVDQSGNSDVSTQPGKGCVYSDSDIDYLEERIKEAQDAGQQEILVSTIPTVMYTWDIKDLKRLMLADPHVESTLSTLLRSDITFKLNNSSASALGTRLCGVPTQARGDQDIRLCTVDNQ
jgi:hypothetical protein